MNPVFFPGLTNLQRYLIIDNQFRINRIHVSFLEISKQYLLKVESVKSFVYCILMYGRYVSIHVYILTNYQI